MSFVLGQSVLNSALFELCKGHRDCSQVLMLATWHRPEKFKLNLTLDFVLAEVCGADLNLIPLEGAAFRPLNLRFVDWCKLARCDLTVDNEEAEA